MPSFSPTLTNAPLTIRLSERGIVSDATGGLDYTATAPTGTGQEAAINAVLTAAKTAAGVSGVRVIWDVAVALGGPIYLHSNMTIECPSTVCGAILRVNANCPILRLKGMELNAVNGDAASLKTFGKVDTAYSNVNRRVFDPTQVNANNVTVNGGTWNGNYPQQGNGNTTSYGNAGQCSTAYGWHAAMQFFGVNELSIRNVRIFKAAAYGISIANAAHVRIADVDIDNGNNAATSNDALHFNGPSNDITVDRIRTQCRDDHIAFNADDVGTSATLQGGGSFVQGVTYPLAGPITGATVTDHLTWFGRDNAGHIAKVRMLSNASRIDDIVIRRQRQQAGQVTSTFANTIGPFASAIISGNGNFGRVVYDDISGDLNSFYNGYFAILANIEEVEIRGRTRINAASVVADVYVGLCNCRSIRLVDCSYYQPTGATINAPVIQCHQSVIKNLIIEGRTSRETATAAAPILLVTGGTAIETVAINFNASGITNMVDLQNGTITNLTLNGLHRTASGGSPVATATGTSITNLIASGLSYYHAAVSLVSGAGTIVRSGDYSEGVAIATSYTLTAAGGATSVVNGQTLDLNLTPVGGLWPTGEVVTLASTVGGMSLAQVSGCTVSGATVTPTGAGSTTTPAVVRWTPNAQGSASITATNTNSGTALTNPTALAITVNTSAVATTFSVGISPSSGAVGSTATLTLTPITGTWPSGRTLAVTQSVALFSVGTITQPTAGTVTPVSITLTVTATGGPSNINATDSGTTPMTSTGAAFYTAISFPAFPTLSSGTQLFAADAAAGVTSSSGTVSAVADTSGASAGSLTATVGVTIGSTQGPYSLPMFSFAGQSQAANSGLIATPGAAWIDASRNVSGGWTRMFVFKTKGTLPIQAGEMIFDFEPAGAGTGTPFDDEYVFLQASSGFNYIKRTGATTTPVAITGSQAINTLYKCLIRYNGGGTLDMWVNGTQVQTAATVSATTSVAYNQFGLGQAGRSGLGGFGSTNSYICEFRSISGAVSGTTSTGDVANLLAYMTSKWG